MSPTSRVRPGTPDGGRFAATTHTEAAISLTSSQPESEMTTIDLADLGRCPVCRGEGATPKGAQCGVCEGVGALFDDAGWTRAQAAESACTSPCPNCVEGLDANFAICGSCDGTGHVTDYSLAG